MTWRPLSLLLALAFAGIAPLLPRASLPRTAETAEFPGWPSQLAGAPLQPMPPAAQDAYFSRDFPGKVARFSNGDRQVVMRWVNSPTRRLHPARNCFTGAGYEVLPESMAHDHDGALMSCFIAKKPGKGLRVCEVLRDSAGRSWPDVSSWYWHAVAAPAGNSWWSYVVVEHEPRRNEL